MLLTMSIVIYEKWNRPFDTSTKWNSREMLRIRLCYSPKTALFVAADERKTERAQTTSMPIKIPVHSNNYALYQFRWLAFVSMLFVNIFSITSNLRQNQESRNIDNCMCFSRFLLILCSMLGPTFH